jgi:cell cycle checkpoint protein
VEDVRRWFVEAFEGGPSGKLRKYRVSRSILLLLHSLARQSALLPPPYKSCSQSPSSHTKIDSLSNSLHPKQRILALTGPAGTAKTATVRVLSRELGFEIVEWRNSMSEKFATDYIIGSPGACLSTTETFRLLMASLIGGFILIVLHWNRCR